MGTVVRNPKKTVYPKCEPHNKDRFLIPFLDWIPRLTANIFFNLFSSPLLSPLLQSKPILQIHLSRSSSQLPLLFFNFLLCQPPKPWRTTRSSRRLERAPTVRSTRHATRSLVASLPWRRRAWTWKKKASLPQPSGRSPSFRCSPRASMSSGTPWILSFFCRFRSDLYSSEVVAFLL